jgi:hypothetical protein
MIAIFGACLRPGPKLFQPPIVVYHDITGPFQIATVDHDVAGQQETRTALRPSPIERFVLRGRAVICIAKAFCHCGLGDPVI